MLTLDVGQLTDHVDTWFTHESEVRAVLSSLCLSRLEPDSAPSWLKKKVSAGVMLCDPFEGSRTISDLVCEAYPWLQYVGNDRRNERGFNSMNPAENSSISKSVEMSTISKSVGMSTVSAEGGLYLLRWTVSTRG